MSNYPFGNPDAARGTPQEDALAGFIDISSTYFSGADSENLDDFLKTRAIVGPKGSGKTLYLRKIKASLHSAKSIYSHSDMAKVLSLPTTDQIIRFSQCFGEDKVTGQWQRFWKSVIIITLISHILSKKELSGKLSNEKNSKLLEYIEKLQPNLIKKILKVKLLSRQLILTQQRTSC